MELIENKVFYHIQRQVPWNNSPFWTVGDTHFIGKEKNPFFKVFDYAFPQPEAIAGHYMKVARELIFEEVRNEFFPSFPSRTRCLWVMPDNQETFKYWWNELQVEGSNQVLLKLNLTGKVFEANQQHLKLDQTFSLDFMRQKAFRYWSGSAGDNPAEIELLFEGFAHVVSVEQNPF
ncbi:DUF2441 domain-containing protein [Cytobacillus firmus]|uniref:DUF2441 domain-containing protein n=1 Tax=Cytobacillus firmus TaxID=1399 RepID=UPI0018CF3F8F|nr:DUF2441 domain-containing protein [Cytobacillus firmus]